MYPESSFEKTRRTQKGVSLANERERERTNGTRGKKQRDQFRLPSAHAGAGGITMTIARTRNGAPSPTTRARQAGGPVHKPGANEGPCPAAAIAPPPDSQVCRRRQWWCSIHGAQIPPGSRDHHHCPRGNKQSFIAELAPSSLSLLAKSGQINSLYRGGPERIRERESIGQRNETNEQNESVRREYTSTGPRTFPADWEC